MSEIMASYLVEGSAKASKHYQVGTMQPIEIMQDYLSTEELIGFLKGNILKYTLRSGHKDNVEKEAAKIKQYSHWLWVVTTGQKIKPMEDR